MDRTLSTGAGISSGSTGSSFTSAAPSTRPDGPAQSVHQTVDDLAERATGQVGRLSGAAHRAVDTTAAAATSAAEWASNIPEQARQGKARMSEAACDSIRARPIASVAGALVAGYLLGRLARF